MGDIVAQLQDYYPDSSFMVFNFREGDKRTKISDILSKYDMTVMDYPRQYGGCQLLPLEMIRHCLISSESWLSLEGQQTVLLMHCERGGWPLLAFMLAALLLFRKQYNGEQKTLEMVYKQAPRELLHLLTPLDPRPSQLRYLQYISRGNLGSDWPPSGTPLALDCIILRFLPLFGEKGYRPVVHIYGQGSSSTTANGGSKLLFSSSKTKKLARYYRKEECEQVKIDIHHRVQGDVVLECINLDHAREEMMFRVMFHTAFIRSNILMLSRDEVDIMWDAKDQMARDFRAEVLFSDADFLPSTVSTKGESEYGSEIESASPRRYGATSPPPPPPRPPPSPPSPSVPDFDVSELETLFSAIVPKKDGSKGGGRKSAGSKTENVHLVLFSDADALPSTVSTKGESEDGNEIESASPEDFVEVEKMFQPVDTKVDHLLQISERVYVFDCCISMEVLEEDEYDIYMGGVVADLHDCFPYSSFMVFNFGEGDKRTQISDILSQYDMTVNDYPREYEGCQMLPLDMIHRFLVSSESWLSLEGQQNVLLMHCEREGWPMLAFMLAALLLFQNWYRGEQKTLDMVYKQAPGELLHLLTPLNPQPSQLRYLQYISRRNLFSNWPPSDTPLVLGCIILRVLPVFGKKGCRPVVRIYGGDASSTAANRNSNLIFSSSKTKSHARYYRQEECELVKIDIHHHVQGDVVLECIHLDDLKEEMMFRIMFHTASIRSNILMLNRDEVDVLWDAKDQMAENFTAEVLFLDSWQDAEDLDSQKFWDEFWEKVGAD